MEKCHDRCASSMQCKDAAAMQPFTPWHHPPQHGQCQLEGTNREFWTNWLCRWVPFPSSKQQDMLWSSKNVECWQASLTACPHRGCLTMTSWRLEHWIHKPRALALHSITTGCTASRTNTGNWFLVSCILTSVAKAITGLSWCCRSNNCTQLHTKTCVRVNISWFEKAMQNLHPFCNTWAFEALRMFASWSCCVYHLVLFTQCCSVVG